MKTNEVDAILGYLEFHLLTFVEETEQSVTDPDIIGDMYDRAYRILSDFEQTLFTQMMMEQSRPLTPNKKDG